jgi:hypothetical protein
MANLLKIALLFLTFATFLSCGIGDIWDSLNEKPVRSDFCREEYYNNKVQVGKYYSEKYVIIDGRYRVISKSAQYNIYEFVFYEDSSFSYLRIFYQNDIEGNFIQDTIAFIKNGKYRVYKDSNFPWYVLKLDADFIYEKKVKDTLNGVLHFVPFSSSKFKGFEDKFFTNTDDGTDNCFILSRKYCDQSNSCGYPKEWNYYFLNLDSNNRIFCLEQPEETPEQNSTGDSL